MQDFPEVPVSPIFRLPESLSFRQFFLDLPAFFGYNQHER